MKQKKQAAIQKVCQSTLLLGLAFFSISSTQAADDDDILDMIPAIVASRNTNSISPPPGPPPGGYRDGTDMQCVVVTRWCRDYRERLFDSQRTYGQWYMCGFCYSGTTQ